MTVRCHTVEYFRNRPGMNHSTHSALLHEPRSLSVCPAPSLERGPRVGLASLVAAAGLLTTVFNLSVWAEADPAPAAAPPAAPAPTPAVKSEKERFTQVILGRALECSWRLEGRVFVGKDLAGKGLELTASDVTWDDDHVHFAITIAPNADLQALLATRKSWTFHLSWGYARRIEGGAVEAPELILTDPVGVYPAGKPGPAPTPPDWRKLLQKSKPVRAF